MKSVSKKKINKRYLFLLLLVLIPTTVLSIGIIFVPGFRNAIGSIFSSHTPTSSGRGKPVHSATSRVVHSGSEPDSAAGSGEDGALASETQSQVMSRLKAQETGITYYYLSVIHGKSGSNSGKWNFENKNSSVYQQAVLYECDTNVSYQKQSNGVVKKVVEDIPTTKIGETPIVGAGQHSTDVLWFQPIVGKSRAICAFVHNYNRSSSGEYSERSKFFAQNLTLDMQ